MEREAITPGDSQNLGAPGRTRTFDPRLRRPVLYPTELRARALHVTRPPEPVGLERRHSGSVDRDRREESPSGQPGRSIEGFEERCPHVRSALQCPEHFSVGPRRMSRHSYVPHRGHIIHAPREYIDGADHTDREVGFDFAFDAFKERVHAVEVLTASWRQKWDRRQAR